MACIDDILCGKRTIIGIRNFVECEKPESRIWINDYPGLSFKSATKITNDEMTTGNEVLKTSIEQGIKLTYDDFIDFLRGKYNLNTIAETRQLNNFSDAITPKANLERGLILKRWRSEMAKIQIEEIYIKTDQETTVEIKIYDGDIIKTYPNNVLVAGVTNTIRLDYVCTSEKVKVLYNQIDNDVYKCNFNKTNGWDSCGCGRPGDGFVITGWNGTSETNNCFGMGVLAYIRCYEEEIFCALLPRLYTAMYYNSVIQFLKHRIYTERVNNFTTFGVEKAESMLMEAEALYRQKYERVIENSQSFFNTFKGDCLTCNTSKYVQSHP